MIVCEAHLLLLGRDNNIIDKFHICSLNGIQRVHFVKLTGADPPSRNASNDENAELLGVATRVIVQQGNSAKCNKQYICAACS